ncbi:InlB B-repeat-containing protein [Bifidobacterium sp. 82T24]|uniref:InlB B-repeat-containing protein n=1 Tax=Bifidobacterium pluvialisilvae TaxID=2834436 RepID=UPI001C565211|nr:InlB B-repeat-containing protein [Bifidobacterium pluvialisilvae]MBW3087468.1 InlB B-repeat-containing protein [Bifidobacterium pluvialisilvae]
MTRNTNDDWRLGKRVGSVALAGLLTVGMIVPAFGMTIAANAAETETSEAATSATTSAPSQTGAAATQSAKTAASAAENKTPAATATPKATEPAAPQTPAEPTTPTESQSAAPKTPATEAQTTAPQQTPAAKTETQSKSGEQPETSPAATAPAVNKYNLAGQDGTVVVVAPDANNAQIETNLNMFLGGYDFAEPAESNGAWTIQATLKSDHLSSGWTMVMSKFSWLNPPVKATDFDKTWAGTNYTATFTYDNTTQKWTLTTPVKLAVKTEAQPIKKTYTLTFESNGGSETQAQKVETGKKASKPADPTRQGYKFAGWYTDAALTKAVDWSDFTLTDDTTVYAKWTQEANPQPAPEVKLTITGKDVKNGKLTLKVGESRNLVGTIDVKSLQGTNGKTSSDAKSGQDVNMGNNFRIPTRWTSSNAKVAGFDQTAKFADKELQDTQKLVAVAPGKTTVTFSVLDPDTRKPVEGLAPTTLEVTVVPGGTAPKTTAAASAKSTATAAKKTAVKRTAVKQPLAKTGAEITTIATAAIVIAAAGAALAIARRREM